MSEYGAEALASLFEPDVVLPSQFDASDKNGIVGGERKLMAALLSDGIEAYIAQSTTVNSSRRAKTYDAAEWVENKDTSYVFSFDVVCECLGIDPDYLRLGLSRYIEVCKAEQASGERKKVWKKIRRPRK